MLKYSIQRSYIQNIDSNSLERQESLILTATKLAILRVRIIIASKLTTHTSSRWILYSFFNRPISAIPIIAATVNDRKEVTMKFQAGTTQMKGVKGWLAGSLFVALAVLISAGQEASSSAAHSARISEQTRGFLIVESAKALDSKKLREGDEVDAKLAAGIVTADGRAIPAGAKVIGHVTEAKARSKGDAESTLGIVFDKIIQPGSGETPINSVIQAAAPSLHTNESPGGVSYPGLDEATAKNSLPMNRNSSVPILNEQSRGVLEIKNLQLGPGGVFISSGKEVKLDSGIQILLDVTM